MQINKNVLENTYFHVFNKKVLRCKPAFKAGLHLRTFLSSTFLSCWRHKIMSSTFLFLIWGHSNWRTKMLKTFVWYRLFFRFWEQKSPQNDVLRCKCKSTKMSSKTPIFMSSTKKSSDVNPPLDLLHTSKLRGKKMCYNQFSQWVTKSFWY